MDPMNAFEGETYLAEKYEYILDFFKPDLLIETGTHLGNTTKFLVQFGIPVLAIEKQDSFVKLTTENVGPCDNLTLAQGDSPTVLEEKLDFLKDKKILAFLDAHWGGGMILQRELEVLAKLPIKPYLIIHDFYNPNHPEFTFDAHDNIPYKFEHFKDLLENIYGNDVIYTYNDIATGAKQGALFVEPTK